MKKFSKVIAAVFHPLLMPVYLTIILFESKSYFSLISGSVQNIIYSFVIISTLLLPLSIIPVFLKLGLIKSFEMEDKHERSLPLFFTAISYLCGCLLIIKLGLPMPIGFTFSRLLLSASIILLILTIISRWWKISIHMTGIGGFFGALVVLSLKLGIDLEIFIFITILISGILGTTRIYLKAHNNSQIFCGFLVGFICMILALTIKF